MAFRRSTIAATNLSWMPLVTISRDEAVQRWPVEKNAPLTADSTAVFRSASSSTTSGFLPPISSWIFFICATALAATLRPVSTEPVKLIASTRGSLTIASPDHAAAAHHEIERARRQARARDDLRDAPRTSPAPGRPA